MTRPEIETAVGRRPPFGPARGEETPLVDCRFDAAVARTPMVRSEGARSSALMRLHLGGPALVGALALRWRELRRAMHPASGKERGKGSPLSARALGGPPKEPDPARPPSAHDRRRP